MKKVIGIIVAVVIILGGGLMYYMKSNAPAVLSEDELNVREGKYVDYVNADNLVSATQASEMLENDDSIVIIDIRNAADYALGHVEGAVSVWRPDYSAEGSEYEYGGMRSTREKMATTLGNLGIDKDTKIIVYTHANIHDSTRFYWQLKMFGHENVVILDGGIVGWQAAGLPTTLSRTQVTPKEYVFANAIDESKLASKEDVLAAIDDPNIIILDTRAYSEFTGEEMLSGAFRAGRIPGSVWLEFSDLLDKEVDSTFKPYAELKEMFEAKGITKDKTIIAYCQSGVRSSLSTYVLSELLGYDNVKNFDGSWIEWSFFEELPIETGEI